MSNKRKHVEIESELNNTETQDNDNHGVEAPSRGPTSNSNNELSNQDSNQGGQDNQEPNAPTSQEDGANNNNSIPHNQDDNLNNGNTNNKVFDGRVDDNNLDNDSSGNKVEVGGGQLSNQDPTSNKNGDSEHQEDPNNNKGIDNDNKDSEKSNNNDNENNNKDNNNDNNQQNKEKPSQYSSDKGNNNKVSDSSNKENSLGNGLKSVASDKLGKYSDTADKLNKIRNFKDLKNMSKEQATREAVDIGKDLAKKKITALIITYIGPYILPIIAGLVVVMLIIVVILAAIAGSGSDNSKSKKDCEPVNDHSTDITASKDAMKNAEKIYEYEMKNVDGAKPKAVAAHLGNMEVESAHTFDPKTIQGGNDFKKDIAMDESVGGYAFGLAQWDSGRRVNLLKHAEKEGKKWSDFGLQLDFLLNHDGADSDTIKKILKSDGSVDSITERIMNEWERAGDKSSISERQSAASKFYSKFGKKDIKSSDGNLDDATDAASDNSDASENSGCSDTDDTGGSGKIGDSVKANGKSGEIKEQWNSKKEIPKKYKKHIKIPDFKESVLNSSENIFPATGNKGQCTELTWGYMKQMYGGTQPTNGNGNVIYKAYEQAGAKVTKNPTVGYGFSSNPPHAGAADASVGHTGIVAGVMDNGDWIMANYNLNGEGNNGQKRHLTYALVDGNKKSGGIKFFSGVGKPKVKSKD
ncbi:phage tail tip lysozyme [Staphylococcus haemolyticus]|uniref:phage tail tip lysozyme n=1 Tax=Staphylococcus haemolyticus TaxID=1283 RepID=UPI003F4A1E8D